MQLKQIMQTLKETNSMLLVTGDSIVLRVKDDTRPRMTLEELEEWCKQNGLLHTR